LNAEFVSRSQIHLASGQHTGNYPSNAYLLIESRENVESAERRTGYLRYRGNFISIAWASLRSHTERRYCLPVLISNAHYRTKRFAANCSAENALYRRFLSTCSVEQRNIITSRIWYSRDWHYEENVIDAPLRLDALVNHLCTNGIDPIIFLTISLLLFSYFRLNDRPFNAVNHHVGKKRLIARPKIIGNRANRRLKSSANINFSKFTFLIIANIEWYFRTLTHLSLYLALNLSPCAENIQIISNSMNFSFNYFH